MAVSVGDKVIDPRDPECRRAGKVVKIHENPACLMRSFEIQWEDNPFRIEELEAIEFGDLDQV
jgi:hypothetical protein